MDTASWNQPFRHCNSDRISDRWTKQPPWESTIDGSANELWRPGMFHFHENFRSFNKVYKKYNPKHVEKKLRRFVLSNNDIKKTSVNK